MLRAALLLTLLSGPALAVCDPGEVTIRFPHDAPATGHPKGEAAAFLADLVNRELDGRACMVVEAEAGDYSDAEVLAGLADGRWQMAAPSMGNMGEISPRFLVFDLPFLFRDMAVVLEYQESNLGRGLLTEAVDEGLLGLAFWADGMKAMSATRRLEAPTDLEGLTFGTQDALIEQDYFAELGAETHLLSPIAMAEALQTGRVAGQNSTWTDISARGLHYAHDSVTESNHGLVQYMLVTAPDFWEGLDPELRAELELLIELVSLERNRFAFELANMSKMQIRQDQVRVVQLDDVQRHAWVVAMQPTWFRFGGEIGFDQIAAVIHTERGAGSMIDR
ncbi:TRAP transporter substrate-binding protein DctP [Pontivivens ytuae]|uniref:TRAP transporter substrate-binding protein DctP n=1 Tax=Pontivivens ytuae TaxID=2789856 RepID=A0A7S9LNU6_9RHOB|nr:TRAP transporter substrate-binding protein DctP [Pontivivens ytuae]QPH52528.1 TRAP transporter substrate-binding protein DctP [Pontivivens ytuae]